MADSTTTSLTAAIVCLILVAILSIPATSKAVRRLRSGSKAGYQAIPEKYEDEDGVASEESEAAYSDFVQRLALILLSIVGILDSLALAVLATARAYLKLSTEQWLQFATWLLLLFQAVTLYATPKCTRRFELGFYGGLSSLLLEITIVVENFALWSQDAIPAPRNVHVTLSAVLFAVAFLLLCAYISIPRRPDVFRNGKVVDRQYTTSLIGRYGFSWPGSLLRFAAANKTLDISDLPEIDHELRSKNLNYRFEAVGKKDKLWKSLFWSHKVSFIAQWILVTVTSITNFLPQIALLYILRALEDRDAGRASTLRLWIWVLALGASITVSSWIEAWLFFVVFSKLGIPIYEQLSAVIFGKAMRRKDVKGTSKKEEADSTLTANDSVPIDQVSGFKGEDTRKKEEEDEDEDTQQTRQSTINLIGVDGKRIADFATFSYIFPGTVVKLAFAFAFLISLIGWLPLLAGLLVPVIVMPINVLASKRYAKAQDGLMKMRDQKMAVVTEALQGIRQIKFSALERQWNKKILDVRGKELKEQWTVFVNDTILITVWILGPVMLAAAALAVYAIVHKTLSASIAFTTISVFEALEMTLAVIPELITDYLDAQVSADRIQKFLDSPEKEESTIPGPNVSFENVTIAWPSDVIDKEEDHFRLRNITLSFPKHELSVISGKTGSGKSLLLASILGESDVLGGTIQVPKAPPPEERYDDHATPNAWYIDAAIAFVAQIPWIENATIRDNILWGLPHHPLRYQKVLHACALEKDLEILPDGELTDIGANGINLSGGQKWRVSFARALYSRAGILVLDDIFSAVDAHVGRHLLEEALTGELGRGRTRILVTHHVALTLPKTKYSVLLGDGGVQHAGNVEDLRKSGHLEAILQHDVEVQKTEDDEAQQQSMFTVDDGGGALQKILSNKSNRSRRESNLEAKDNTRPRRLSTAKDDANDVKQKATPKKFTEEEKRETGAIKYKIYVEYIRASGGVPYWMIIMVAFAICIGVYLGRSWWISLWTRSYHTESVPSQLYLGAQRIVFSIKNELQAVSIDPDLAYYLGIYVAWSLAACFIGALRFFLVFLASIWASKDLFEQLLHAILRAPLRWLDTVPVGRVLNRFTSDFNMIDSRISMDLGFMLNNAMQVLEVIIAGVFVSPWMIAFALALLAICIHYAIRYLTGAREVKRLESNAKSPIFEQFGSALLGIGTIRAFDKAHEYIEKMFVKIDQHAQAYWHLWLFNRWLSFRLNMIGALFSTITAALIVSIGSIDASLAGFALSFALEYSVALVWALRQYANVELDMNAAERIVEYSNIAIESQEGDMAPAAWPTEGRLEVSNLVCGYAPDLPPVLKGLSFSVKRNQRIGVVGRTGAGKSSLTLALFRFLEAREGIILIDGVDISKIKLHDLRSRLAIIPQDPVLFSGTVRSNLDAFDEHNDTELRDALQRVHLISDTAPTSATASGSATPLGSDTNMNVFRSLSSKISEGGLNLSQGQRQLLCLARAIVARPKIMVLDEATSAVDMETDALIQRSIREEFQDSTLIVIAHRLSTIADFDKILVMGDGKALEYDEPRLLMEKDDGAFRKMVEESGERDILEGIIHGVKR
jgi:ABC-type multidrug transport system fused ATPase/permease subunit